MIAPSKRSYSMMNRNASEAAPAGGSVRTVRVVAAAALAITPLALVTGVFISHDVIPKVILLTSAAAFLLFLFPEWVPLLDALWSQPRGKLFLILVAAQWLSLLFSTLFSGEIPLSLGGTVWRRFGLIEQTATLVIATSLTCAVAARSDGNAWINSMVFRSVGICGGLAATYGILQYFGIDPFLDRRLYSISYLGGIVRTPATMGHAIYFSAYLVPVLFISTSGGFSDPVKLWRHIQTFVAILSATAIVLSATRGAIAAALAGGILFAWSATGGQIRAVSLKYATILAAALLAIAAFVLSPAGTHLRNRMAQWREDFGGPRFEMWRECPALIAKHPVLGEGPERFAGEFRKIQSAQLSRLYPDFYNETPHNALIDAACAQGLPGLLILAAVFVLAWWGGSPAPGAKPRAFDPVRSGLDAAILGILISSMFASFTLVESLYLWSITGLSVGLYPGVVKEGPRRELRIARIPAMVCGTFLLATGAILALQDSAWADLGKAVGAKDLKAARKAWSRATSSVLSFPGYELWGSREFATLGQSVGDTPEGAAAWKLAAESAALAEMRGEEKASAAYQSSMLGVAAGDLPRAESKARETIQLAPNWYRGHLLLSQILPLIAKNEEARREAALSVWLSDVCAGPSLSSRCSTTTLPPSSKR